MKVKLPVIICLLLTSFLLFPVFSQVDLNGPELKAEEDETLCTVTETMLDAKILDLKLRNSQNSAYYQILLTRLGVLSNKAKLLGYMVTSLDTNIATLKTYVVSFDKSSNLLIQKLELAKTYACNELQTQQYEKSITESKKALHDTISNTTKINDFFINDITQNIITLTKQEATD